MKEIELYNNCHLIIRGEVNPELGFVSKLSEVNRDDQTLTDAYKICIYMHMRTTLNIDDQMLDKAASLTGIKEKTALVRLGLEALIAQESRKRLASLGGSEKDLKPIHRRRA